jgi:hypothetical protein
MMLHPFLCQFIHENLEFFEVSEIILTCGSLIQGFIYFSALKNQYASIMNKIKNT